MRIDGRPNIFTDDLKLGGVERGLRATELLRRAGAERLGATLYELRAGSAGPPLHFHHGNEEVLIVLSGAPTVRTPDGESTLTPGDVIAFPTGSRGAHAIENRTRDAVRYLMLSTRIQPDVVEYPDAGTLRATTRSVFDPPPPSSDAADAVNMLFDRTSAIED